VAIDLLSINPLDDSWNRTSRKWGNRPSGKIESEVARLVEDES
jgi:hypothetical protein